MIKSTTTQNVTLFRGIRYQHDSDRLLQQIVEGGTYSEKGFVSTCLTTTHSHMRNAELIFQIDVPKGTHAISVGQAIGDYAEAEVILDRGMQFRINKIEREKAHVSWGRDFRTIVTMTVMQKYS